MVGSGARRKKTSAPETRSSVTPSGVRQNKHASSFRRGGSSAWGWRSGSRRNYLRRLQQAELRWNLTNLLSIQALARARAPYVRFAAFLFSIRPLRFDRIGILRRRPAGVNRPKATHQRIALLPSLRQPHVLRVMPHPDNPVRSRIQTGGFDWTKMTEPLSTTTAIPA